MECKQPCSRSELGLVWFYGISTIVGYLMPNPVYTYIKYIICKRFVDNILNEPELIFCTQLNGFKYFNLLLIICLHKVKWFQVLLCNSHSLISVICLHSL